MANVLPMLWPCGAPYVPCEPPACGPPCGPPLQQYLSPPSLWFPQHNTMDYPGPTLLLGPFDGLDGLIAARLGVTAGAAGGTGGHTGGHTTGTGGTAGPLLSGDTANGRKYAAALVAPDTLAALVGYVPTTGVRTEAFVSDMRAAKAVRAALRDTYGGDMPISAVVAQYAAADDVAADQFFGRTYNLMLLSDSALNNLVGLCVSRALGYLNTALLVFPDGLLDQARRIVDHYGTLTLHQVVWRRDGLCCVAFMAIR